MNVKTNNFLNIAAGVAMLSLVACEPAAQEKTPISMENELDKFSYSLGVSVGENIKKQGVTEVNPEAFAKAMEDVFGTGETQLTAQEADAAIRAYFDKARESENAGVKQASLDFLAENAKREGIITTASGLQYEVITEGNGPKPTATSKVNVHYHGTTPEGIVFDSSVDRGEPISFGLNQVIRGWTEGLQLMSVGSKYKFYIPQELAYGANPRPGGPIKPYMALVFEVELIAIED